MNSDDALKELDLAIEESKRTVEIGKSLSRLFNNRDFKKVVLEGYFKEEAVRLVSIKGNPNMQSNESQASIIRDIDAIGSFMSYLHILEQSASQAQKILEDCEQTREEIIAEENQ